MIVQFRLAAYEELYRRMKAQAVEDYRAALKEQVHCDKYSTPLIYVEYM